MHRVEQLVCIYIHIMTVYLSIYLSLSIYIYTYIYTYVYIQTTIKCFFLYPHWYPIDLFFQETKCWTWSGRARSPCHRPPLTKARVASVVRCLVCENVINMGIKLDVTVWTTNWIQLPVYRVIVAISCYFTVHAKEWFRQQTLVLIDQK